MSGWRPEYDEDTGQHRIYEGDELIACVGNAAMRLARQQALARAISDMAPELIVASQNVSAASARCERNHADYVGKCPYCHQRLAEIEAVLKEDL